MRQRSYLRQRYRVFFGYAGEVIAIIGAIYLIPLLLLVIWPEEAPLSGAFLLVGAPLLLGGIALRLRWATKVDVGSLSVQEGFVIMVIIWVTAIVTGIVPYMLVTGLDFSQALFESTSMWTTTGFSIIDIEAAPRLILFYRSFVQFAGGAGFAIIAVIAVSTIFGTGFSYAEGRTDQLAPQIRQSATIVLRIYLGYMIIGIVALRAAGMGWFDAVNHAFTALATGGYSTRVESIGYWDSAAIEAVIILIMLVGSINFGTAYLILRGKVRLGVKNGELRFMAVQLLITIPLLYFIVTSGVYDSADRALRVALFEIVSAMTTTGLTITTYTDWGGFGWLLLIILMLIGGGTGSTAGAIKQFRIYILYKSIIWEIRRAFMPPHMVNEPAYWQGETRSVLSDRQVRQVALFVGLYMTAFLIGSAVLTAYGYPLRESLFEFSSALGGVGLSSGIIQADMPDPLLWLLSLGMLLGRLEFLTVIIGILKVISDTRIMLSRPESRRS